MASVPRTIRVAPVTVGETLTYELPAGIAQFIQSVYAEIDATGSGATTPLLSISEQTGVPIAVIPQDSTVAGGATGRVTWALRLSGSGTGTGGSGIQFDTDPQDGTFLFEHTTGNNPSTGNSTDLLADGHFQVTADGRIRLESVDDFSAWLVAYRDVTPGNRYSGLFQDSSGSFLESRTSSTQFATVTAEGPVPQVRIFATDGATSGDVTVEANSLLALISDTGNITIDAAGNIIMPTLPIADPGVSGALWNSAGTLKISP